MKTQMDAWNEEYDKLKALYRVAVTEEKMLKEGQHNYYKQFTTTRRNCNRKTKERLRLEKDIATFWSKKKAKMYRQRIWTVSHLGEAMQQVMRS